MTQETLATKVNKDTGFHPVTKPAHYNKHTSGIECLEIARHLSFDLGNAFKYVFRFEDKENPTQDLQKALVYIDDELSIDNHDYVQLPRDIAEKIKILVEKIQRHEPISYKGSALFYIAMANQRNINRNFYLGTAKRYIQELIDSRVSV